MLLLVSGASQTIMRYRHDGRLGWLLTPRNRNSVRRIVEAGVPWAADNDCYQRLDREAYISMLRRVAGQPRLLFVAVPDVLCDARATYLRFRLWAPVLKYYGLPAAYVAQDGQEQFEVPWSEIAALFIGGSTMWKEGPESARLIREAKEREIWVHVGRVNTLRRMWLMVARGADSMDGTCFSRFPDKFVPWMLRELAVAATRYGGHPTAKQLRLFEEAETLA